MAEHASSVAKSLFVGQLREDMVFPYPRPARAETGRIEQLVTAGRDVLGCEYDPQRAERQGWVGDDTIKALGERGLLGLYVSPKYGGQGLSQTGYCRVMEEFGGVDSTLSVVMGVHQSIGMKPLHLFGTDEQQARYLPDLAAGRRLAGFALTEPGVGSDAYHVETRAEREADGSWRLNGEKRWIGNGDCDVLCVFARSEQHGHVALIVEGQWEGVDASYRYDTLGLRGNSLRHIRFSDVRVPAENLLGEVGDGFRIAMHTLNNGRMSLGTGVVGGVKTLIRQAIEHTETRRQFGRPLCDFELVEDKIGWMVSYLYGLESMAYLTTGLVDRGVPDYSLESAMTKVAATEFMWYAVNRAFQLAGGEAYMSDHPLAKTLRDTRVFTIFEGANDVLQAYIALSGLKVVGEQVEELRHLSLSDPLHTVGALGRYVAGRVTRGLNLERLDAVDPALRRLASQATGQVATLRQTSETLLRRHGEDIQDRQRQQRRLSLAATDIYAQLATLSRATARVEDITEDPDTKPGEPARVGDQERAMAVSFCDRAAGRADTQLRRVDDNDDHDIHAIARQAYHDRGYAPRLVL